MLLFYYNYKPSTLTKEQINRMDLEKEWGTFQYYKNGGKIKLQDFLDSYKKNKWRWRIKGQRVGYVDFKTLTVYKLSWLDYMRLPKEVFNALSC